MKISLVIPCFNAADTIGGQLEALARQEWSGRWEVIVADNGSTDGSLTVVERYRDQLPQLRIVDASQRPGGAHARNVGAAAATGDALAFCDADDEVAPGWLAAIASALACHDAVACRFDGERLNADWLVQSRGKSQWDGLKRVRYPPYLDHSGGSGLAVKRWLHDSIGGFDETLLRLTDTDYCFRIQLAGTKLHFAADAVVHVRYRATLSGLFHQTRLWDQYNALLAKRYRPPDVRRDTLKAWVKHFVRWGRLALRLFRLRSRADLARWVRGFGSQVGVLQGCIRYRVPPF